LSELTSVIEQLHRVRAARGAFLCLWAMEQAVILPGLDRFAADINSAAAACGNFFHATDGGEADEGM
jgi:hypothetical protein